MSLYRNAPSEATSFPSFRPFSGGCSCKGWAVLFFLSFYLLPSLAQAGFWEEMLTVPKLGERYPSDGGRVIWDRPDMTILCVVQIMDGLGRLQAAEINRLKGLVEEKANVVLVSLDRDENKKWPTEYIKNTWDRMKLTVPISELTPEGQTAIYQGFDHSLIRILPQTLIFNRKRTLFRILEGFHTAEDIQVALSEIRFINMKTEPQPTPPGSILVNGDFMDWPTGSLLPTGWEIRDVTTTTFLHVEFPAEPHQGIAEIRRSATKKRQILFQRLANTADLWGKRVRLSAYGRSNSIGKPVVALAMPVTDGGRYRLAPESPFITGSGREIPLRILTTLDFEANSMAWCNLSQETLLPEGAKLFVVMLYLESVEAPLAAGQFESVSLEILDN